ncbi:MAG: hypothetical protein WAM42_17105 [Candidatus Nitrosopolaris sp.]
MPVAARCSAQALAPAASVTFHTSGGTVTLARALLCTARMLVAKSAVAFPVLLLGVDPLGNVAFVVDPLGDVALLLSCAFPVLLLSCAFPVLLLCCCAFPVLLLSCPFPVLLLCCSAFPVFLLSCAFAVAANIPSIRIPATKIDKIIIAIGLCTMSCKNDYNLIRGMPFKGVSYKC